MEIHLLFHRRARSGRTNGARGERVGANTQIADQTKEKRVEIAWQAWRGAHSRIQYAPIRRTNEIYCYFLGSLVTNFFALLFELRLFERFIGKFALDSFCSLLLLRCCPTPVAVMTIEIGAALLLVTTGCSLLAPTILNERAFRTELFNEMVLPCLFFFAVCENTKNFYLLIKACSVGICKKAFEK